MNEQYKSLLTIWINFGSNTQKLLISQSTQNYGGIRSIKENLRSIELQSKLKIRGFLGVSSRRLNVHSSISKFKKLQEETVVLGNL